MVAGAVAAVSIGADAPAESSAQVHDIQPGPVACLSQADGRAAPDLHGDKVVVLLDLGGQVCENLCSQELPGFQSA